MTEIAKLLGERIRNIRKEMRLSQEQLGELAGLHEKYIGQVERGEKNLSIDSLYKIADGLNLTLEELFRSLDPIVREDDLGKLLELLIKRPKSDHTMILNVAKVIFEQRGNSK
ncbi:helix-turn-helix domain-containing protein [Paenibacillus sp. FSL H7-0331]|uniref:helix-turn-helix domain-containing protein n=1 Tax=Paenibacillus sp. FSL H7-0331 TaxID=1920421 RepID=UPI00096F5758|nr:helix-turn-helix transcriptional regulator [Paenibacillus sp. FSL H7-0331]OMF07319.1 transcriptional regulator [Paenibacillus sp. FSL H7-0331]